MPVVQLFAQDCSLAKATHSGTDVLIFSSAD